MIVTPPRVMWMVGKMRESFGGSAVMIALSDELMRSLTARGAVKPCTNSLHPDHLKSAFGIPAFSIAEGGRHVLIAYVDPIDPEWFVYATDGGTEPWGMGICSCHMDWLSRSPQFHSVRGCYPLDEMDR